MVLVCSLTDPLILRWCVNRSISIDLAQAHISLGLIVVLKGETTLPWWAYIIALLLGAVIGEPLAGYGSDLLVSWRTKRAGGERLPEYRLPLAYPGFVLAFVGLISRCYDLRIMYIGELMFSSCEIG